MLLCSHHSTFFIGLHRVRELKRLANEKIITMKYLSGFIVHYLYQKLQSSSHLLR